MSQTPPVPPQQTLPIASQPFPGSLTPGWNDPPAVPYNTQASSTSTAPGRTKLNKRVPFPLQQQTQSSTKPTAIVHAFDYMPPTGAAPGSVGNIAVVHPMQMQPTNPTTLPMHFPTTSAYTLPRESSQTPPPPPPAQSSTAGAAGGGVPTMTVAAVPRRNSSSGETVASTSSAVQHI